LYQRKYIFDNICSIGSSLKNGGDKFSVSELLGRLGNVLAPRNHLQVLLSFYSFLSFGLQFISSIKSFNFPFFIFGFFYQVAFCF